MLSILSDKSSFLFWVASDVSLFQPKQNMFLELTIIDNQIDVNCLKNITLLFLYIFVGS